MRTIYLNADFDLSLRPRPRQIAHSRLVRQVRALSLQAIAGSRRGESVLIRAESPSGFLDYLAACRLEPPRLLLHPAIAAETRLEPFGWSDEAIELNRQHRRPTPHPSAECVRAVNSRGFARRLERELGHDPPAGDCVADVAALERFLASGAPGMEWVVKSEHGHAAMANRRLRGPGLSGEDRRFVLDRLAEDDQLIVERWLPREHDLTMVFDVPFDPGTFRVHETINTSDGAPIGVLFDPDPNSLEPWRTELRHEGPRIAGRLAAAGYFGPVCVDAIVWRDGGRLRLRPLVDLNCRHAMSAPARRLWHALEGPRVMLYRFFNRRKLSLPGRLDEAVAATEGDRYDPTGRRGVLFASPLEVGLDGAWRPNEKPAVIFLGSGREDVLALERRFRRRFES